MLCGLNLVHFDICITILRDFPNDIYYEFYGASEKLR